MTFSTTQVGMGGWVNLPFDVDTQILLIGIALLPVLKATDGFPKILIPLGLVRNLAEESYTQHALAPSTAPE